MFNDEVVHTPVFPSSPARSLHSCEHLLYLASDLFIFEMISATLLLGALACAVVASPIVNDRAFCTFTDAATAIKNKASCSTITLSNIAVPAGTTLDLTGLKTGTHVCRQRLIG